MDNHPNVETLALLREAVARHGVGRPLPTPALRHCDDCGAYGASYALGSVVVCLVDWLRRQHVDVALQALERAVD